jgi:hypothetical protein
VYHRHTGYTRTNLDWCTLRCRALQQNKRLGELSVELRSSVEKRHAKTRMRHIMSMLKWHAPAHFPLASALAAAAAAAALPCVAMGSKGRQEGLCAN